MRLRLVSWNVHGCVGLDRRFTPERTADVLLALAPDVALLQEVGDAHGQHPPIDQAESLSRALGFECTLGITLPRGFGYGNATLSRLTVLDTETWDLSVRGREPRCCVRVVLGKGGTRLTTVNTHLGLRLGERHRQAKILVEGALEGVGGPLVLGGDFNDFPPGRVSRELGARCTDVFAGTPRRRTFPSWAPLLPLDRVYARSLTIHGVRIDRSALARAASDHLPLVVELEVPDTSSSGGDPP
jgi:endonuclease/exonuclease/phosphatase family metal-dependent hydrolase